MAQAAPAVYAPRLLPAAQAAAAAREQGLRRGSSVAAGASAADRGAAEGAAVRARGTACQSQSRLKLILLLSTVVVPTFANNEIHYSVFGYFDNFQFNLDLNCFRDLAVLCKI